MQYPVVVKKNSDTTYNVLVPDLEGCRTSGVSMEEALQQATETVELHLDKLTQDGHPVPMPRRIEDHQSNAEFHGGVWALVRVDVSKHLGKSKRINITIPERLLIQIDKYTMSHGGNRSAFLANAALNYISRQHYHKDDERS